MEDIFREILFYLNTSPTVYLGAVLYSIAAFGWMKIIAPSYRKHSEWLTIIFILINGMIPTALSLTVREEMANLNPVYIIMSVPILLIIEFSFISKDKLRVYIFHVCTIMLHLACFFGIAASAVTSIAIGAGVGVKNGTSYSATISLTMFLMFMSLAVQSAIMKNQSAIFRKMVYDDGGNYSPTFIFSAINGPAMGLLSAIDYNIYFSTEAGSINRNNVIIGMVFRYLIITTTSLLIIYTQCKTAAERNKSKTLSSKLSMAQRRRNVENKDIIFEYTINITKGFITSGSEFFSKEMWQQAESNYLSVINELTQNIVHPDDTHIFKEIKIFDVSKVDELENKAITKKFRYDTEEAIQKINFSQKTLKKIKKLNKKYAWAEVIFSYLKDDDTDDIYAYVTVYDIDDREEREENLEIAATFDPLTKLLNRAALEQRIKEKLIAQKNEGKAHGALFLLDLDHFKEINDNFGHPVGDEVLTKAANIIKSVFREGDVVGRLGGDEFCIFIDSAYVNENTVETKGRLLNERLRISYTKDNGHTIKISTSIGIVIHRTNDVTYEELYKAVDVALYKAKEKGRDCYVISD